MHNKQVLRWAWVVLLLILAGCGDGKMATVSGTVQLDGQPVKDGAISFIPADGQGPTAGSMVKDGQYSAQVPIGLMKVSLSAPKVVGHKKVYATPNSPEMPVTAEAIPARYNEK